MSTNENLPPNVIRELAKELKHLDETPPEGIKVIVDDDNFANIQADIDGPAGTPYENGVFRMKLVLPHDFPLSAPKGFFITKIFHPNVAINGEICVNALKKDWNPTLGLRHVLVVVRCLLIEPFPESALNEQAGKMLLDDYEAYARHARLLTGVHALKPKAIQESVAILESTTALNVPQINTVVKESITTTTSASPAPLSPCMSAKWNCGPDANISLNAAATEASTVVKKDVVAKPLVDKKKMEARKKSLKRL